MKIEIVNDYSCELGESPVWDEQQNEICWVDILKGEIHQYSFNTNKQNTYYINEMIGSIAISEDSNFIYAAKSGIGLLDRTSGIRHVVSNPEKRLLNNRFNDGKCDPLGRFWAGTMSLSEEPNAGSVYLFDANHCMKKIENVTVSNGLAWSIDYKTMYYIDTPTLQIVAYDYDIETGNISNRQLIISIREEEGYPDGMTVDNEGMLWVAHWDGWQITRWNPNTAEKLNTIKLPTARITSCTFGGEGLNDLFITSARVGLSKEELEQQPLAGSLFVIRNCGFKGLPTFRFKN